MCPVGLPHLTNRLCGRKNCTARASDNHIPVWSNVSYGRVQFPAPRDFREVKIAVERGTKGPERTTKNAYLFPRIRRSK